MTDNMKSTQGAMLLPLYLCAMVCLLARIQIGAANVVLMGKNNLTLSFNDVEANIVPGVKGSGVKGVVYTAEPLNACSPLTNKVLKGPPSPFALVIGGGCTFDEKVKNVHDAGFKAAIVYDHENSTGVPVSKVGTITVAGRASGIHIYAVFISKVSGEVLKKFSGSTDVEVWIIPIFENSARLFMAISFISLVAMTAVLVTCFFLRRHRVRRDQLRNEEAQEFHGMSSQFVKAIPSLVFTEAQEDNCTSTMCAICLEDYNVGEKLRVLPCRHKFHAACVDMWLMSWRSFCPVCKGDAGAGIAGPSASETTPLFSSAVGLPYGSAGASPPRPISRRPSSQSISRVYYVSGSPHSSYRSMNGSLADLANMFSPCLGTLHLGSTRSPPVNISYAPSHSGYGSSSPHLSSSYISNSGYGSSGHYHYLSSSSQHHRSSSYLRRCGESGPNLSTMATQSPQQSQLLCHGGDSETSLNHLAAGASSAQSYLRHCGDSDASLSAMASSGQSLAPFSTACMQEMA